MHKNEKPLVSVVVLSWNTLDETKSCLRSIQSSDYENYEIVVVDNGSVDGSKEYLRTRTDIEYVDLPENTGFTGGQIAGYEAANGMYLALVNSDAVIAEDWLSILVNYLELNPDVAAAGGKAYTWKDGEKPFDINNDFYTYQEINQSKGYAATLTTGENPAFVESISGAGVIIRRSSIEKTGYFDNRFFAYYEETDLFARMIRNGFKIAYVPEAHVWHMIAKSTKNKPYFYLYQMHRNRFLFAMKNFDAIYAFRFFFFYLIDGLRANYRYLKTKSLDDKARAKSLWWNLSHLFHTLKDRKNVQSFGGSYNQTLNSVHRPTDVTVVIPCYNYADHVGEAIESVLNQTTVPSRIVVIDDGSTDSSVKVIKSFTRKGVELISKPNEGVIATKNRGIQMTRTTWTIFLDADDVLPTDYIEKLVNHAVKEKVDVVYTDMRYFGAKEGLMRAGKYSANRLLNGNYIHNSALIATHLLKQINGYKEEMKGGYEDWELYISLMEAGAKFSYLPRPLLQYRQHPEISRNADAEARAKELHNLVESLHPNLYKHHHPLINMLRRSVVGVIRNPLLIPLLIINIPYFFGASIKAFLITYKHRVRLITHNYLEKQNDKRIRKELGFDEQDNQ